MQKIRTSLKPWLVFPLLFLIPMVSGLFFNYQSISGFISPALLLLITWLLYRSEGKSLRELGLTVRKSHLYFLLPGFLVGILYLSGALFLQAWTNGISISFNPKASYALVAAGILSFLPGVLNEELIFRGYCFKKSVEGLGRVWANLLFGLLFMIWHWIAWDAWGNWGLMAGAITTAFGHWLFATSLLGSGTLFLPIGLHLGNNWAARHLFLTGEGGKGEHNDVVFLLNNPNSVLSTTQTLFNYCIGIIYIIIFIWLIAKGLKMRTSFSQK